MAPTTAPKLLNIASPELDGAHDPADLSRPLYGAPFGTAIKRFFAQYARFSGRASRSEYWWAVLFVFLVELIPNIITMVGVLSSIGWAARTPTVTSVGVDAASGQEVTVQTAPGLVNAPTAWLIFVGLGVSVLIGLVVLIPQLAVLWRRLHDANLPGAFVLFGLLGVGGLAVVVFTLMPPKPEGRRFDSPRESPFPV